MLGLVELFKIWTCFDVLFMDEVLIHFRVERCDILEKWLPPVKMTALDFSENYKYIGKYRRTVCVNTQNASPKVISQFFWLESSKDLRHLQPLRFFDWFPFLIICTQQTHTHTTRFTYCTLNHSIQFNFGRNDFMQVVEGR